MSLNPALLNAVTRMIGPTRVINEDQELVGFYYDDVSRARRRLKILKYGETILVNCPCCSDERQRMSINHRYGVPDDETGDRGTYLWKCYNEECQQKPENRAKIRDLLLAEIDLPRGGIIHRKPRITRASSTELEPVEFPGIMIPLSELPATHAAPTYLRERGFDVRELTRVWDVGYAETMPARREGAMSQDRIIIPVRQKQVMIGWQARYIGDIDWTATGVPKYLTYFPKSMALYGCDQAASADIIVLVEGASDVWRYGPGAVCGFGKSLSHEQINLLIDLAGWPPKPLVIIPDANDRDAFDKFCRGLGAVLDAGYSGTYALVPLPPGKDPGSMPRATLRDMVRFAVECAKKNEKHSGDSPIVPDNASAEGHN